MHRPASKSCGPGRPPQHPVRFPVDWPLEEPPRCRELRGELQRDARDPSGWWEFRAGWLRAALQLEHLEAHRPDASSPRSARRERKRREHPPAGLPHRSAELQPWGLPPEGPLPEHLERQPGRPLVPPGPLRRPGRFRDWCRSKGAVSDFRRHNPSGSEPAEHTTESGATSYREPRAGSSSRHRRPMIGKRRSKRSMIVTACCGLKTRTAEQQSSFRRHGSRMDSRTGCRARRGAGRGPVRR